MPSKGMSIDDVVHVVVCMVSYDIIGWVRTKYRCVTDSIRPSVTLFFFFFPCCHFFLCITSEFVVPGVLYFGAFPVSVLS